MRTTLTVIVLGLAIARCRDDGKVSPGSVLAGSVLLVAGTGVVVYGGHRCSAGGDHPGAVETLCPLI